VLGYTGNPNSTAAEVKGCVSGVGKDVVMLEGEQEEEQEEDVRCPQK
jgi:hypothetical protein